jgi:hypothetical protein
MCISWLRCILLITWFSSCATIILAIGSWSSVRSSSFYKKNAGFCVWWYEALKLVRLTHLLAPCYLDYTSVKCAVNRMVGYITMLSVPAQIIDSVKCACDITKTRTSLIRLLFQGNY